MLHCASHYLNCKMLLFLCLHQAPGPRPTHTTSQSAATQTQHKSAATWFSPNHLQQYRTSLHFQRDTANNSWRRLIFPTPPFSVSNFVCVRLPVWQCVFTTTGRSSRDQQRPTHTRAQTVYWHSAGCLKWSNRSVSPEEVTPVSAVELNTWKKKITNTQN